MTLAIVNRPAGAVCAAILADLPQWFGMPASNAAYVALADGPDCWVASDGDGAIGVMTLKRHGATALENYMLAVRPTHHRRGIGRALLDTALAVARQEGRIYLTVKTLGPSIDYAPYARTRAFYCAYGFVPIEEFTELWGPESPALLMVRPVEMEPVPR